MNELLNDWLDFCAGNAELDKSHFLSLFNIELDDEQLQSVFAAIPNGQEMYLRAKKVLEYSSVRGPAYTHSETNNNVTLIESTARSWLSELHRFCGEMGESRLEQLLGQMTIAFSRRGDFEISADPNSLEGLLLVFVGDEVDSSIEEAGPVVDALMEALYGIAADYYLCWYVMQSIIPLTINFDPYFELWSKGVQPIFTDNEMVLILERPERK